MPKKIVRTHVRFDDFLFLGIIIFLGAIFQIILRYRAAARSGVSTAAEIIGNQEVAAGPFGATVFHSRVRFREERGNMMEVTCRESFEFPQEIGKTAKIIYSRSDPAEIVFVNDIRQKIIGILGIALFWIIADLMMQLQSQ